MILLWQCIDRKSGFARRVRLPRIRLGCMLSTNGDCTLTMTCDVSMCTSTKQSVWSGREALCPRTGRNHWLRAHHWQNHEVLIRWHVSTDAEGAREVQDEPVRMFQPRVNAVWLQSPSGRREWQEKWKNPTKCRNFRSAAGSGSRRSRRRAARPPAAPLKPRCAKFRCRDLVN